LRGRLQGCSTRQLVAACARLRLHTDWDEETRSTAATLRSLARRIRELTAEAADHRQAILVLVQAWRPELLTRTGVGPIVAATVLCAWSHAGRCRSDAAFAMLGGAAPIPASSGQTVRVRLNRCGDRQLNQALYTVVLTRLRTDPATRAYTQRRRARARPTVRSNAAWSAMSPASSTDSSRPDQHLTQHRSVQGMTAEQAKRKERTGSDLRLLVPLAGLEPATCCLGDVSV
jgi:transposase